MTDRTAIIGIGNKLMGDEGVGIHAIEYLREKGTGYFTENGKSSLSPLDLIDGGAGGMTLLHVMEEYEHVIIIDAAGFGGQPGDVKAFDLEKVNLGTDSSQVSLHGTSFAGIINFARTLGQKVPKITIVAIQPKFIGPSLKLSDECKTSLDKCRTLIATLLP